MAYSKRLQIEYKDINQVDTRIEVHQEGYAGAVTYREYANDEVACEVTWGDNSSKRLPVVYGSQASIYFDSETDFEFHDFFSSNSRKNKILVYKNNVLFSATFAEADTWEEPLVPAPYEVGITGYDGLGLLKEEDFLDSNKNYYTGQKTPLQIIAIILAKTGLDLPINTAVGIRPIITTGDPLVKVLKDVVTYQGMSCYEVLTMLLQGCRIFQRDGEWWIISNDKWTASSITCYHYTSAGVADGTVNFSTEFAGFWYEDEPGLEFMPAMKQITVKQEFGYKGNLIENSDFGSYDGANFDDWTAVGVTPQQRVYDSDGNKYVYLPGIEHLNPWESADRQKYLVGKPMQVNEASDQLTFSLSYALMGPVGSRGYVFFALFLDGDNGVNYTLEPYLYEGTEGREVRHRWSATLGNKRAVPVKAHVKKKSHWPFPATYHVEPDVTPSYPYNEVINHFEDVSFSVEGGIPTAGTMQLYLFLTHTDKTVAGNCFRNVKLLIADEDEQEYASEREFVLVNDLGNNHVPEDITMVNGDLPAIPNRLTLYDGGFIYVDGLYAGGPTTLWQVDNHTGQFTYAEMVARLIAAEMKLARQSYRARLADAIPGIDMVFVDTTNSNKRYLEAGITYNDRMQTIDGRYCEVKPYEIDSFTVIQKINYGKPSGEAGTGGSGGGTVIVTTPDEKVKLVDPSSMSVVGQAGYLSSDFFEQTIDETTGRVVIKPIVTEPDGIISGGKVVWVSGLTNGVTATAYRLNKLPYQFDYTTVTHDAADATYTRRDVIALDATGPIIIKGTPGANPIKPQIDPLTQIELTDVWIEAGATEPTTPGGDPIVNTIVYDENTEWTAIAAGTTVDYDSLTDPAHGSKCAEVTNIGRFDYLKFISGTLNLFADFGTLTLMLKLKAEMSATHSLFVVLMQGAVPVSNFVRLSFNIYSTAWQKLVVSMDDFTKEGTQFDAIAFMYSTVTDGEIFAGFYLDYVYFQGGLQQPVNTMVDTYVTGLEFNQASRILKLKQNNEKEDIEIEIPYVRRQDFFLHNDASDIATYESLLEVPADHTEEIASVAIVSGDGETLIQEFSTAVGTPGTTKIDPGIWEFDFYHYVSSSNTGDTTFVYRVYKRAAGGTETELFNAETPVITAEVVQLFKTYYAANTEIELLVSDRLVLKVYAKTTSASAVTSYLVYEGDTSASHLQTPAAVSAVSLDEKVKYDAGDTAAGYLKDKIVAGDNVTIEEGAGVDENKVKISATQIQSDWNQATDTAMDFIKNKPSIPTVNANYLKDWIEFEFGDFTAGTAKTYTLNLKALVGYTIDSLVLQVDNGTLGGIAVQINAAAVTGLSAVTATTTISETAASGGNTVVAGDLVTLSIGTGFTGAPTVIKGQINLTRT